MKFNGLVSKLKSAVASAKGVAITSGLGLASLVAPYTADAQTLINEGVTVRDSNGNVVANGGNLQQGQTYLINMNLTGLTTATNTNFSSVLSTLRLTFSNGATFSDASFGY